MQTGLLCRAKRYLVPLLVAICLTACGDSSEDEGSNSAAAATARVDACKLLASLGPESILGGPTDAGMLLVEAHRDDASISQCQFAATDSERTLGLLMRRVKGSKAPASRQAYFEDVANADDMGAGAETVEALQAGREIAGLGDLALTYDLFTFNLMVWSGEDQFTVMLYGFGSDAEAESRLVSIAKSVLAKLQAEAGR